MLYFTYCANAVSMIYVHCVHFIVLSIQVRSPGTNSISHDIDIGKCPLDRLLTCNLLEEVAPPGAPKKWRYLDLDSSLGSTATISVSTQFCNYFELYKRSTVANLIENATVP